MPLNEYGVDELVWARLPQEDKEAIIASGQRRTVPPPQPAASPPPEPAYIPGTSATYGVTEGGKQLAHDTAVFAAAHGETSAPPPPPPVLPRAPQAAQPAQIVWVFVRSLNSFPGNHPYFDSDRAAGVQGYMLMASDPYLEAGAQACHAAGFRVGVWDDPHGASGADFAARLVDAAHRAGAEAVGPDPESTGKGYEGSAGWQWNQDAATALRALDAGLPVIVLPVPMQDDFNYAAWVAIGASVAVQAYGEHLTDTVDPIAARNRVIANGVPGDLVSVILPAGSLSTSIPQVQSAGLAWWMVFTADDITPTDRTVPFGEGGEAPPSDSSSVYVPPANTKPDDDADTNYEPGEEGDTQDAIDFLAALPESDQLDFLAEFAADDADSGGLSFLSASGKRWVLIASYANRAGHPIHAHVTAFVRRLAIAWGHPLTITCGTNHNRYVAGSHPPRQSQHWTGDAADIGMSGAALTRLGQLALIVAGARPSWAHAQHGGAFTVRGVNILFNTMIGGNHFNHLHVGLLSLPSGLGSGAVTIPAGENVGATPGPEKPPPPHLPSGVRMEKNWHALMLALDPELVTRTVTARSIGRSIIGRVK